MTASPTIPRHPLDHPGVTKILLGQSATDALQSIGPHYLVISTHADATAPDAAQGRMVLHCMPCSKEQLDLAFGVIRGTHTAKRIRLKPTPSPALTPKQLRTA